jgi:hypothetical protein
MPQYQEFFHAVYLSNNSADKPRVRWLAERLRAATTGPSSAG